MEKKTTEESIPSWESVGSCLLSTQPLSDGKKINVVVWRGFSWANNQCFNMALLYLPVPGQFSKGLQNSRMSLGSMWLISDRSFFFLSPFQGRSCRGSQRQRSVRFSQEHVRNVGNHEEYYKSGPKRMHCPRQQLSTVNEPFFEQVFGILVGSDLQFSLPK